MKDGETFYDSDGNEYDSWEAAEASRESRMNGESQQEREQRLGYFDDGL